MAPAELVTGDEVENPPRAYTHADFWAEARRKGVELCACGSPFCGLLCQTCVCGGAVGLKVLMHDHVAELVCLRPGCPHTYVLRFRLVGGGS